MPPEVQWESMRLAQAGLAKSGTMKDVAKSIKKHLDEKYGRSWHCIIGRNFGSYVSHEKDTFVFFYIDQIAFMVFKTA
jgi:dynein light chain LC8-type